MDTRIIEEKFKSLFGDNYMVYTSPGRVNLIGEHTDYNGGFVFPGAIDKGIYAAINPNGTDKVRAYSADYNEQVEFAMLAASSGTALPFTIMYAISNIIFLLLLRDPFGKKLNRIVKKYGV